MAVGSFLRDKSGAGLEPVAAVVGALAIAGVVGAHFLDQWSKDKDQPIVALLRHGPDTNAFGNEIAALAGEPHQQAIPPAGLDYTPVGAIPALQQPVVLDPCSGAAK